jgi:hypothetical protein
LSITLAKVTIIQPTVFSATLFPLTRNTEKLTFLFFANGGWYLVEPGWEQLNLG